MTDSNLPLPDPSAEGLSPEDLAHIEARDAAEAVALAAAKADPTSWWNKPPTGAQWWATVADCTHQMGCTLTTQESLEHVALNYLLEFYGQDSTFHIDISDDIRPVTEPGRWPAWLRRPWDPQYVAARALEWAIMISARNADPRAICEPVSLDGSPDDSPHDGAGHKTEHEIARDTSSWAEERREEVRRQVAEDLLVHLMASEAHDELTTRGLVEITLASPPDSTGTWTDTYGPYPDMVAAREVAAAVTSDPVRFGYEIGSHARVIPLHDPAELDTPPFA